MRPLSRYQESLSATILRLRSEGRLDHHFSKYFNESGTSKRYLLGLRLGNTFDAFGNFCSNPKYSGCNEFPAAILAELPGL